MILCMIRLRCGGCECEVRGFVANEDGSASLYEASAYDGVLVYDLNGALDVLTLLFMQHTHTTTKRNGAQQRRNDTRR